MSRGKPIPVGPTARLPQGMTWDSLAQDVARPRFAGRTHFLIRRCRIRCRPTADRCFPRCRSRCSRGLQRFDVDLDLPEEFLPEFPPAIFLQSRPELGDVSRGEVVSINNYYRLFKDIITPVQLDGLRLLLTPFPQEEFNPTDDRKSPEPSLGVTCLDCHVNGHTTGQFHLNPDDRPQERRFRLDTVSLRGVFNQQIHGSQAQPALGRGLHRVRAANGLFQRRRDSCHQEGHEHSRPHSGQPHGADAEHARLSAGAEARCGHRPPRSGAWRRESELRGEKIFFGKGQCSVCHPAPVYLDNQMHDLHLERFLARSRADGPIKTFTLRGIKDSPPYLHDGRCLTLEDTVEFFNLVLSLKLSKEEKDRPRRVYAAALAWGRRLACPF